MNQEIWDDMQHLLSEIITRIARISLAVDLVTEVVTIIRVDNPHVRGLKMSWCCD